jgi:K+-transporting ATPase KdpF subunit
MMPEIWLPGMFLLGLVWMGLAFSSCRLAKESNRSLTMIFLTAVVSLLLFIYLFVALIRPEWF